MEQTPVIRTKHIPDIISGLKVPRLNYYLRNKYFIPYDDSQGQGAQRYFLREELYLLGILHSLTEQGIDINRNILPALEKNRVIIMDLIKLAFPEDILIIRGDTAEPSKEECIIPAAKKGEWNPIIVIPVGRIIADINDRIDELQQLREKVKKQILAKQQAKRK